MSPLTLCSLRGKRHDQRKVVDIERKEGRKAGRRVKKNRKNEGKTSEKKKGDKRKRGYTTHIGKVKGRE